MWLFAHTGLTLGAAALLTRAVNRTGLKNDGSSETDKHKFGSCYKSLAGSIDIRLLMVGALLPDIIDKPLWIWFPDIFTYGRMFAHTLLFLVIIAFMGLLIRVEWRKNWLLVLSAGTFTHLIFDEMWRDPYILFWPVRQFLLQGKADAGLAGAFWRTSISNFFFIERINDQTSISLLWSSLNSPSVYIPEIIGIIILIHFFIWLLVGGQLLHFIKTGRIQY